MSKLIRTALTQSRQNLLVPLRQTTEAFLSAQRTSGEYNLYLQSISHIPFRSPESTRTVKAIFAHIDDLNSTVTISTTTYTRLIRPSFTPVPLLAYLHHRLAASQLPLPILLSFLTAYSKLSNPAKASLFFDRIHAHPQATPKTLQHASTLLLSAQQSQQDAYNVLISPSRASSDSYDPHPYNSSASLHVLSKDLSVPPQKLIQTFLLLTSSLSNPPLLPLYTSLINGLVLRHRYDTACLFFNKLLKLVKNSQIDDRNQPKFSLDIPSLAAGINALTRAGRPHDAFQLLESYYPPLLSPSPHRTSTRPTSLALPLLSLLTALIRISRPDISTLIFFLYPTLYPSAPPPNSHMLNLLLQAGRLGVKMDLGMQRGRDDLPENIKRLLRYLHTNSTPIKKQRGRQSQVSTKSAPDSLLTKLNLRTFTFIHQITSSLGKNLGFQHVISKPLPPFGRQRPRSPSSDSLEQDVLASHPHPRLAASNLILTYLGHPSRGGLRHFVSSAAYQGVPSGMWARVVFLRVLAGVGTQMQQPVWEIKAPAVSHIPASSHPQMGESSSAPKLDSFAQLFSPRPKTELIPSTPTHFLNPKLWENLLLLPSLSKKKHKVGQEDTAARQAFYPSIIPTNSNFFNYIVLLALSEDDQSIPPVKLLPNGRVVPHLTSERSSSNPESLITESLDNNPTLPPASPLEIPLVLAWMQTFGIQPSNSTLAVALLLWGEACACMDGYVSSSSSLSSSSSRTMKPGEREYLALVDYLRAWVGERRLPHWRTLEKWKGVLRVMRGVGGGKELGTSWMEGRAAGGGRQDRWRNSRSPKSKEFTRKGDSDL